MVMSNQQIEELIQILKNKDGWRTQEAAEKLIDIGSDTTPALIECLNDPDAEIRSLVAHLLKVVGDQRVLPALRATLRDSENKVRKYAVQAIGRIGAQEAIPDLRSALTDVESEIRRQAVEILGQIGSQDVLPDLIRMLDDANTEIQIEAIKALGKLKSDTVMYTLKDKLGSDSVDVSRALLLELGQYRHPEMLPVLLSYLGDAIPASCPYPHALTNAAVRSVAEYGDIALPYLLERLSSPIARTRESAAECLGRIGNTSVIPALLEHLNDENDGVRWKMVMTLGEIGDTSLVPHLILMLGIDDPEKTGYRASAEACRVLQKFGTPEAVAAADEWKKRAEGKQISEWDRLLRDPRTTEELIRTAVEQWDKGVDLFWPRKAIQVLIARGDIDTLEAIKALCTSSKPKERIVGVAILGKFSPVRAFPYENTIYFFSKVLEREAVFGQPARVFAAECMSFLLQMLEDETDDEVLAIISTTLGYQDKNKRIVDALSKLKTHPSESVRLGVVYGLLWYEDEQALSILMELMKDPDEGVRYWATMGVASIYEQSDDPQRFNTPEIRQALFDGLDDPDWNVKRRALIGLAVRRDTRAIDYIVKMLVYDCYRSHRELYEPLRDMLEHYTGSQVLLERALRCLEHYNYPGCQEMLELALSRHEGK
jgi:HEAT repeat protein